MRSLNVLPHFLIILTVYAIVGAEIGPAAAQAFLLDEETLGLTEPAEPGEAERREAVRFLNGYVNSVCDFIVPRAPFGGRYTHYCRFVIDNSGLVSISIEDGTGTEGL